MQIDPTVVGFIGWMAGILTVLAIILFYLERRQQRTDELEENRMMASTVRMAAIHPIKPTKVGSICMFLSLVRLPLVVVYRHRLHQPGA